MTMSFGRRLALFFLLIAIVPTAALISILLFVSGDSQRGKADARLAQGLQTAVSIYNERAANATARARHLAGDPDLAVALRSAVARHDITLPHRRGERLPLPPALELNPARSTACAPSR